MLKIGLTGGIGSGKSTVTGYLRQKGYTVADADEVAREIVMPGAPALKKLQQAFGSGILAEDGSLRRKALADIVFADEKKRKILDDITHGEIYDIIVRRLDRAEGDLAFCDAALLFESGLDREMDAVWLVTADEKVRIQRVAARDNTDAAHVRARIESQLDDSSKIKSADEVIDNSGSKEELFTQVEELLKKYGNH